MKQHITTKQLNGLSEKGEKKLRKWYMKRQRIGNVLVTAKDRKIKHIHTGEPLRKEYEKLVSPLLSIGQMMEFIVDYDENWRLDSALTGGSVINPCDDLWENVKEILEK